MRVEPTALPNLRERHECRQCCSFCDRVVHPSGCIESGCPYLYLYDDEETGVRYMEFTDAVRAAAASGSRVAL